MNLRSLSRSLAFASVTLAFLGCSERTAEERKGSTGAGVSEKSPTADILPAPLASGANRAAQEKAQRGAPGTRRRVRSAFSAEQALAPEMELKSLAPSYAFWVDVEMPGTVAPRPRNAHGREAAEVISPLRLEGLVLSESETTPARQILRFRGPLWPFPDGTELRSRSDKLGWLLVWPDGRSYRVVPEGALGVLLEEGRVDVMPRVEGRLLSVNESDAKKKSGHLRRIETERGTLSLELSPEGETLDAGHLLCDFLTELLRARREPDLCALGEFPRRAVYSWEPKGSLTLRIDAPRRRTETSLTEFQLPPVLPIWKPGELPPGAASVARLDADVPESPGSEGLEIWNDSELPLFVSMDGSFLFRLAPDARAPKVPARLGKSYFARDLFGLSALSGTLKDASLLRLREQDDVAPEPVP